MLGRRTLIVAALFLGLLVNQAVVASPNGLGAEANEGCLCHTAVDATQVQLSGLPVAYEANTTYTVTLEVISAVEAVDDRSQGCLLYTSPSPRDGLLSRMPSSA